MRAYARKAGADEELWGLIGLLHDFDYEKYPTADDHPYKGCEILKERGYSEEVRRAIMSHAEYSGVARVSPWKKPSLPAMNSPDSSPPALLSSRENRSRKSKPSPSAKK